MSLEFTPFKETSQYSLRKQNKPELSSRLRNRLELNTGVSSRIASVRQRDTDQQTLAEIGKVLRGNAGAPQKVNQPKELL